MGAAKISEFDSQVGIRIRKVRSLLKVSQRQVAEALGVMPVKVFQFEHGKCVPSRKEAEIFCALCGVSMQWLAGGDLDQVDFVRQPDQVGAPERLAQMREELGITQAALARKIGVNSAYISQMETGRIPVTERFAEKVEERMGVGMYWILYGDPTQKEYPLTHEMIEYLKTHEKLRRSVWEKIRRADRKETTEQTTGKRVRKRRTELNLTQKAMSEKLRITQATLSRIESGGLEISENLLPLLADVLQVSEEWIRTGFENERPAADHKM